MIKFDELELNVSELKTGDLILMRYGWMPNAIAIRAFTNLDKADKDKCPFNHVAMVIMVEGKPYIAEAKGSGTSKLESALTRLECKKIAIRRPKFLLRTIQFNKDVISYSSRGVKYDFKGTFFEQAIFQLTGYSKKKSNIEGDEKLYCSEWYARVINLQKPDMYCNDSEEIPYYMVDPQDLYIDTRYETIFEGKADTKC
jgi:hypothetical protein